MTERFTCIWCGCESGSPAFLCTAEDGNGHLFEAYSRMPIGLRQRLDREAKKSAPADNRTS